MGRFVRYLIVMGLTLLSSKHSSSFRLLPNCRIARNSFSLNQIEYTSFGYMADASNTAVTSIVQPVKETPIGKLSIDGEGSRIFFKARQCESDSDFEEAQKLYQEVLTIEPEFVYAWSNLANVLVAQGQLDDALLCYRKAISLRPPTNTLATIILNKASVELSLDKNDDALRDFEIALKIAGPENRDTIFTNKAVALSNKGDWKSACDLFDKVINSAERNALPWWLRYSMALLETKRIGESVAFAQRSLNRFPGEVECNAFAAALYTSIGNKVEAKTYWNTLSEEDHKMYTSEFVNKKLHWGPAARAGFDEFLVYFAKTKR
jgi:tetratricopeptide (TPR) repeat protein